MKIHHSFPYHDELWKQLPLFDADKLLQPLRKARDCLTEIPFDLQLSMDMIEWAVVFTRACIPVPERDRAPAFFGPENFPVNERAQLAGELDVLIERYKKVWFTDRRPGGLAESVSWFEELRQLIENSQIR